MQYYNTLKLKLQRGKGIAGFADNRCNVQCLQWKVPLYNAHSILQYCKVLLKEVALQGLLTTGAICNVLQSIAQRGKGIAMCNVYISKYHKVQLPYCKLQRGNVELQGLLTTGAINFKATDIFTALGLEHVLANLTMSIIIIIIIIIMNMTTSMMIIMIINILIF